MVRSPVPVLCLVVQTGPDRGLSVPLDGSPLSIGRGQDQALQLNDGAVSRHHLMIRTSPDGTSAVISEIAGVNPCWTLRQGTRVELRPGETLPVGTAFTLGNTTLRVEEIHHAEPSANRSGRPSRTVELDATQVIGQRQGKNHLAALAALGDRLARCGSLQAVYRNATD